MSQLRSRRPNGTDRAADIINANIVGPPPPPPVGLAPPPPPGNVNYVLRRYGGLNVFVPSFSIGGIAAGVGIGTSPPGRTQHHPQCPHHQPPITRSVDPDEGPSSSSDSDYIRLTENLDGTPPPIRDPYGKFTPLFGGRLVLGNGKGMFLATLIFLAIYIANTVLMKESIEKYCGGLPVYVTGIVLGAFTLYTFLILGTTDPGVVPKNYSLTELLSETEEYRARYPDERYFRYCNKCRTCRPPRTFHCSSCEICIRQQDTHLWAAGICVGERNRRSYFFHVMFQTLFGAYLLGTSLIIAPHIIKGSKGYTRELIQMISSAVTGIALLFFPQCGIFMLIYKMYLISVGRTAREEYRKYHCYDTNDCVVDRLPICVNIRNFFCQSSVRSAFRRRLNRIDPESVQVEMPDAWILEQTLPRRRQTIQMRDSRDLIQIQNFIEPEVDEEDINANTVGALDENLEAIRLREVANYARGKSTASVPLFEHNLNATMTRIKMPRKSKPSCVLQQQIHAYHKAAQLPKATVSSHKRQKLPVSLSDGCLPRTKDGLQEMIQLSRATQLRRIIQMILLRDREGLIEMSNRVNIAALVGMNRFDPDNLQLLELNNGLPMIAPRRREPDAGNHRLGAGVLGIPQMVAAGLLPTARALANSVETMVGRGRVRRLPPAGRQRYAPVVLVAGSTAAPRRTLNVDVDPLPPQAQTNLQNPYISTAQPTPPPTPSAHHHHHHHHRFGRFFAPPSSGSTSSRNLSTPPSQSQSVPLPPPTSRTNSVALSGLEEDENNNAQLHNVLMEDVE